MGESGVSGQVCGVNWGRGRRSVTSWLQCSPNRESKCALEEAGQPQDHHLHQRPNTPVLLPSHQPRPHEPVDEQRTHSRFYSNTRESLLQAARCILTTASLLAAVLEFSQTPPSPPSSLFKHNHPPSAPRNPLLTNTLLCIDSSFHKTTCLKYSLGQPLVAGARLAVGEVDIPLEDHGQTASRQMATTMDLHMLILQRIKANLAN